MASVKELREELLQEYGCDEYPLVENKKIASLTDDELLTEVTQRNLPIEHTVERKLMEDLLKSAVEGSDEVVVINVVNIKTMTKEQLELALAKINSKKKTIRDIQQELAENCGYAEDTIWDLLSAKDKNIMEDKIKQLIPDQEKGQKSIEKLRDTILESVWAQRKYTNKQSVSYIFYVMVTSEEDVNFAKQSTKFSCHPVIRCRKCIDKRNTSQCCMIYVDETGRVYQNWKAFVENNLLPAGIMVTPRRGVYNFDQHNEVILDVYGTPNGTAGAKVMNVAQKGSAVLGIGAACVPLAAVCTLPIAAPVMAGAAVVGLGVGAFTAVTSALHLSDRKKHEQSISITNSQARPSYLGIIGGVFGMTAAGATRVMTSMAAAGKATAGIEILVNGINITSIVLSGTGVANGVLDLILKYNDDDQITALDVLQLSASLVLFTHSLYNFQLASKIANDARTSSIKNYRENLSNRQRKMFDKMSKETIRINGETKGKIDIIRNINKIPDRQYLNDLFKINKQMNTNKVRPAFGSNSEGVVLNNELPVDTATLRQSVQHQKGPDVLAQVTKPIPSTYNSETPTIQTSPEAHLLFVNSAGRVMESNVNLQDAFNENQVSQSSGLFTLASLAIQLGTNVVIMLRDYGELFCRNIADGQKFQDVIESMAQNLPEKIFRLLLEMTQRFIETMLQEIMNALQIFIPTESVLYRMIKHVLRNYQDNLTYENIFKNSNTILNQIKNDYMALNPNYDSRRIKHISCAECSGQYFICDL